MTGPDVSELVQKDRLSINKDNLLRWFEDRPEFLFAEARIQKDLPDGSDIQEMNSNLPHNIGEKLPP